LFIVEDARLEVLAVQTQNQVDWHFALGEVPKRLELVVPIYDQKF
jgi:hypothetical protein